MSSSVYALSSTSWLVTETMSSSSSINTTLGINIILLFRICMKVIILRISIKKRGLYNRFYRKPMVKDGIGKVSTLLWLMQYSSGCSSYSTYPSLYCYVRTHFWQTILSARIIHCTPLENKSNPHHTTQGMLSLNEYIYILYTYIFNPIRNIYLETPNILVIYIFDNI